VEKVTVAGRVFAISKMDVFKQAHVARRMGPIMAGVIPALQALFASRKEFDKLTEEQKLEKLSPLAKPVMDGFAKLSDEDFDYVLHRLIECAEMENGKVFSKVFMNGTLMFQDLTLPALLQLAGRVFMYNLAGFFSELPQ
jgi:hypothetical protein